MGQAGGRKGGVGAGSSSSFLSGILSLEGITSRAGSRPADEEANDG